jgi:hypothetical protein
LGEGGGLIETVVIVIGFRLSKTILLNPEKIFFLLMIQFYIPWEREGGYDENLK